MKRRVLQSSKILAVALTVSCVPAVASAAARVRPPTDHDGYPLVGNLVRKGEDSARPKPAPPSPPKPAPSPAPAPAPSPAPKAAIG